jgi:hypothetical protein
MTRSGTSVCSDRTFKKQILNQKFSKVSALVCFLYKVTIHRTCEHVCE